MCYIRYVLLPLFLWRTLTNTAQNGKEKKKIGNKEGREKEERVGYMRFMRAYVL